MQNSQRGRLSLYAGMLAMWGFTTSCFGATMTASEAFSDARVIRMLGALQRREYVAADREYKAGADVNTVGKDGISPLLWLIGETRDPEPIEYLLDKGADPNYREPTIKASALYFAAGGSNTTAILEVLLRHKGNPNLIGPNDEPPLFTAVQQDRIENVKVLVQHGADINWVHRNGSTAATQALTRREFNLVLYFLDQGLTSRLDYLASLLEYVIVPKGSEAEQGKNEVIAALRARHIAYPQPRQHHSRP
jgi:uncharacterized protein